MASTAAHGPAPTADYPPQPTIFEDGLRAVQALTAETGDHIWRSIEDATLTAVLISRARTPIQAFEILEAYHRRALEEQSQHLGHVTAMYARALESNLRNLQAVISRG